MGFEGDIWRLLRGPEPVGDIVIDGHDFPWLRGRFVPGPGFESLRPLFARELALIDRIDEGPEASAAWEAAYDEISRSLTLVCPDDGPVAEFLLHIDGERARFRWSLTPFDQGDEDGDA
ncbi:hypothetical protein [Streptomyces sp. NPDC048411]|uniref:hypothetical protein n=1 Tax=Streptomyces sp. NPDC048411 TaxID=3157206 RepID=UPI003455BC8E